MYNLDVFKSFAPKVKNSRKKGNNAVIYTRVSHSSQEDNTSLSSQKRFCENFAKRRGLNVAGYFGGTYESAKTDDRKEFNRMLSFVKKSKDITYIIVYSYERFSRSGINGAQIADDLLKKYGVVTLAVTQELDPTTPSGSFQQNILFLFGQMDNELRRDKTVTGMRELLRKGYYLHSLPRGYQNLNKGSKAVDQKIVLTNEGKLLRKAFLMKSSKNLPNATICRKMAKLGLEIDERRLSEMFSNPFYCGIIVTKMIPGEAIQGRHEAMISKKEFLKINNIVAENRNHPLTHCSQNENLPLKVFMKCGTCNAPMTGYLVKKKGLYYYKCRTKGCKNNKSAKVLHELFSELLGIFQIKNKHIEQIKIATGIVYEAAFKEKSENVKLMKMKLSEVEKNLETLQERFAIGKIDDDIYDKFSLKYKTEIKEIQKEIDKMSISSSNLENITDQVIKICLNPLNLWRSGDIEKKSMLQNFMFPDGIIYDGKSGRVRTTRINALFTLIPRIAKLLEKNKSGNPINFDQISALVTTAGFKPATF